ncbi:flagellar basal body-associated FliL family protein, partial [Alphaproteobacteria bacterium]|nr:flagellar basal body-associated FliL family protein [Alphaproteobacteria bacterium]
PDEKKEIQEIGPDGKVIKPSLSYVDIGGMGNNSNKSFWTNISDTKFFISFDLSFASYEGEDLTEYLTDYDADFRNIVYKEINKISVKDLQVSKGKKLLLNNIKNEFNKYLVAKELEPVVYAALFKVVVMNKR